MLTKKEKEKEKADLTAEIDELREEIEGLLGELLEKKEEFKKLEMEEN